MMLWTWWRRGAALACPECGRTRFLIRAGEYEIAPGPHKREVALLAVCAGLKCGAAVRIEGGTIRLVAAAPVRAREDEAERKPRPQPDSDLAFRRG